jgi:hypothetical protein
MESHAPTSPSRHKRTNLTDRALKGLKPAKAGARYEVIDAVQPSMSARVTDKGAVSFVLRARFPGGAHFTRKALGAYPTLSLVNAREKARAWLRLIGEGKDPASEQKAEAERNREAEQKRQKHTFAYVAERYIDLLRSDQAQSGSEWRRLRANAATTKNLGDRVEIRIRDNGTGIPPKVKDKLFSPFFTTKPAGEGTGLGLSISHDIIVKQHGGSIEVDTQPGEFTEIRVVLPRVAALLP